MKFKKNLIRMVSRAVRRRLTARCDDAPALSALGASERDRGEEGGGRVKEREGERDRENESERERVRKKEREGARERDRSKDRERESAREK